MSQKRLATQRRAWQSLPSANAQLLRKRDKRLHTRPGGVGGARAGFLKKSREGFAVKSFLPQRIQEGDVGFEGEATCRRRRGGGVCRAEDHGATCAPRGFPGCLDEGIKCPLCAPATTRCSNTDNYFSYCNYRHRFLFLLFLTFKVQIELVVNQEPCFFFITPFE